MGAGGSVGAGDPESRGKSRSRKSWTRSDDSWGTGWGDKVRLSPPSPPTPKLRSGLRAAARG